MKDKTKAAVRGGSQPAPSSRRTKETTVAELVADSQETARPQRQPRNLRRSPSTTRCSQFVRKEVADFLPEICESLVNKAIDGDLAALKMLWQMAMLDGKTKAVGDEGAGNRELGFARRALKEFRERGDGWSLEDRQRRTNESC